MASITFNKDEYKAGETATITYVDAPADGYIQIAAPNRTYPYTASKSGSGTVTWVIPADAPLGQYTVELWSSSFRMPLHDTMKVVSGVPSAPPTDGETRELDLGDYEVTWTLSGRDTLTASIRVTDTGVTCLSVTAGTCNSATPPGVTISAFTVTGCLKSAVAPPTKGYLTVNTSPTGATVTVDIAFPCGTTPVTKCELDTGTKTVKITKSGYNTVTRSVTITAGATTDLGTITLTLTGVPPTGFDDWVAGKGGKNAITGGDINELTDAYIGLEDVGFSVTGADVNKVTDYYLGLG